MFLAKTGCAQQTYPSLKKNVTGSVSQTVKGENILSKINDNKIRE